MSIPPVESHLVVFPLEAWGHARPLITLCARVAKAGTTMITFFTTILFVERAKAELLRDFETGEDVFLTRIRIVGLENTGIFTSRALEDAFATAWRKLDVGEEVVCVKTGTPFPSGPRPNAVIFDCFAHQSLRDAKAISGDGVKAYMWFPGPLSSFFNIFGPESLGGKGNIRLKAEEEARRTGKSPVEVLSEMFQVRGNVIRAPGMPPMYDYEHEPQDFPLAEEATTKVFIPAYESLMITDGVFIVTSESYEPEAVATLRGWYKELSKPAHIVGPLLPSGTRALAEEKQQSPLAQAIETFLDETLQTSGKQSLLYISFGSVFWPVKNPDTVWAFLDVVMELGIPFIFSHASPFAGVLPDAITAKVKAYGKGLLSPWSPQQSILNHPATAWFVSHGGQNGAFEAITAGVPLIMWPFSFDQPLNAVHLSESLGIAYELIEVRSGHGLKPILRNGRKAAGTTEALQAEARDVLAKAFGEDGAKKRVKLQQLRSEVLSEWEEGGASKRDFLAFLDTLSKTT